MMIKMRLCILTIVMFTLTKPAHSIDDDVDVIDKTNITVFPQDYTPKIRAGFLSITHNTQLFYYMLAESQDSPQDDPLILWLNGGPGCSSLTGFFTQNGPFAFKEEDASQMYMNPFAWNKRANILYLQSPAGVGFSYGITKFLSTNDSAVAKDNLHALQLFFDRHQQFIDNDFYIAGEGYAGIYITMLAAQIIDFNEGMNVRINLRGILVGNGCTHPYQCYTSTYISRFQVDFLYTRGFIEDQEYKNYKNTCLENENTTACINLQKTLNNNFMATGANPYNLYAKCHKPVYPPRWKQKIDGYEEKEHSLGHLLNCTDAIGVLTVLNTNQFRLPLNINELNDTLRWTPCSQKLNYTKEAKAAYQTLPILMKAGLKIIYFSGDLDAVVPITGSLFWFDKYRTDYGMAIKKSWRPWVTQNQNISGMVWELDGMTLATVRGAGHMVPSDKPAEAEEIFNVFIGRDRKNWLNPDYYMQSI